MQGQAADNPCRRLAAGNSRRHPVERCRPRTGNRHCFGQRRPGVRGAQEEGELVARPVFDRKIDTLFYAVRDADTGEWISVMYRVIGGEKRRSDGWEYSWSYPALKEQPELDPDHSYLLAMLANTGGETKAFYAVIPVYEPSRIWDRILSALNPARWARAFAGWVIEGVHGTLCGAVERASGTDADNCGGGQP
ncbi:MAG: hypothetical protein OXI33_13900 [Chloroflexota bacterium]|nr:hypothetical protein [Chloroflexota bacterium]